MGHISVFQVNDPKSMNFFYNFNIFRISCVLYYLFTVDVIFWLIMFMTSAISVEEKIWMELPA